MNKDLVIIVEICMLIMFFGCITQQVKINTDAITSSGVDYEKLSLEDGLKKKYEFLLPFCNHELEKEILRVSYETLLWGKKQGLWKDVTLEDLMAHALQESKGTIDSLAEGKDIKRFGSIGTTVWDFHQIPSNDLCGYISWSVWQAITPNYLEFGRVYSQKFYELYNEYVTKYGGNVWSCTSKMEQIEGKEKAKQLFDDLIRKMTELLSKEPDLHVKVIAHLIQKNYDTYGVRAPNAIRDYFWLAIQKNLNPKNWLAPVRFKDDVPPSEENNWTDNNVHKRGDYGKQIVLGNYYNDRGMVFWYAVTKDEKSFYQIINTWNSDPAKISKNDYILLKEKGYLKYSNKYPEIYDYILSLLPE